MDKELFKEIFLRLIGPELVMDPNKDLIQLTDTAAILYYHCTHHIEIVENAEELDRRDQEARMDLDRKNKEAIENGSVFWEKIVDQDVSVRVLNNLHLAGIETIGELVQLSPNDLMKQKHIGRKTIMLIQDMLEDKGLKLKPNPKY